MSTDTAKWWPKIEVAKWNPETMLGIADDLGYVPGFDELMELTGGPDELVKAEGNSLTSAGLTAITGLLLGLGGQAFNSANAIIGVGATNTAFNLADTALAGNGNSTTAWYRPADSAPSRTLGVMSAAATFGGSDANFVWNEWCWATGTGTITAGNALAGTTAGAEVMWNRAVSSLGTKSPGAQWTLSASITIA